MGSSMKNNQENNHIQSIFQSSEFNNLNKEAFNDKFKNDEDYQKLKKLKEIHTELMKICDLNNNILDFRGNKINGWSINEKRGNKNYEAPKGWIGIGLKVIGNYEGDDWINNKSNDEWCVAYHGINAGFIGKIIKEGFREAPRQVLMNYEDILHPGKKIGNGVYFTPSIKTAELYSQITNIGSEKYRIVLMVKIRGDKIRQCREQETYWVVNASTDEVRPYRILLKEVV